MTHKPLTALPNDIDMVTFDVFDTLVSRVVQDPKDVFSLMSMKRPDLLGPGFREGRIRAEASARVTARPAEDVSLTLIYEELAKAGFVARASMDKVMELEIETEVAVAIRREDVFHLLTEAESEGRVVAFVSDMYLPATAIQTILDKCGLSGRTLYVSSEIGMTKASGNLFVHVASSEGVDFRRWLHVGDNGWSDVSRPRRLGIRTLEVALKERPYVGLTSGILARCSTLVALNAPKLADSDAFWQGFGTNLALPMVLGLCQAVKETADKTGSRSIFFLARDGSIIKKAYEILYPDDGRDKVYLHASRRVVNFASIKDLGPAAIKFLNGGKDRMTVAELLRRVGITDATAITRAEAAAGHSKINPPARSVMAAFEACRPEILARAKEERLLLTEYLSSVGMDRGGSVLLVDVGWFCSIQKSLERIVKDAGWSTTIHGVYVGTKAEAYADTPGLRARGWLYERDEPRSSVSVVDRCTEIVELLFAAPEHGIVGLKRSGLGFSAVRTDSPDEETRIFVAERLHEAVISACTILAATGIARHCATMDRLALGRLREFLYRPSPSSVEYLMPVRHSLGFGASKYRQIVPDEVAWRNPMSVARSLLDSFWREGFVEASPPRLRPALRLANAYGIPAYRVARKVRSRMGRVSRRLREGKSLPKDVA